MAFCANCGAAVAEGAAFCASCGKTVGGPGRPNAVAPTGAAAQPAMANAQTGALASNVAGALSYLLGFITGIVFLVLEPYKSDHFVRFHAMQSILFSAACVAFSIAWSIAVNILVTISLWTAAVLTPVGLLISLGFFLFWLYLMYQAYSRREFRIPVIGAIAAKQVG